MPSHPPTEGDSSDSIVVSVERQPSSVLAMLAARGSSGAGASSGKGDVTSGTDDLVTRVHKHSTRNAVSDDVNKVS